MREKVGPSLLFLLCLNRLNIGWLDIVVTDPPLEPGRRVRVLLCQSVQAHWLQLRRGQYGCTITPLEGRHSLVSSLPAPHPLRVPCEAKTFQMDRSFYSIYCNKKHIRKWGTSQKRKETRFFIKEGSHWGRVEVGLKRIEEFLSIIAFQEHRVQIKFNIISSTLLL